MFERNIRQFDLESDALILHPGFPALAGITNIKAGDFGYGDFSMNEMGEEFRVSRLLAQKLCGLPSFSKTVPEHKDEIVISKGFHGHSRADGLIAFDTDKKKESGVLISTTADCPTIVFSSADQNLIAIIHSGWKGCRVAIVPQAVAMIKEKSKSLIEPKDLFVGIFPGICKKCYEVRDDVGRQFKQFYENGRLSLKQVIEDQLDQAGIDAEKIFLADYCSCCTEGNSTYPFFSYRRDKTKQRNAVFIMRRS